MKDSEILLNPNKLVQYLRKPSSEFTQSDIIKFMEENAIRMLNLRYVAGDGRLKTLNFAINCRDHLETLLSTGERVDGSSLFSFIEAGTSDLYVIPRFKTAFVNPFEPIPTLEILCSFYTRDGLPLQSAPEYILRKAHQEFKKSTGMIIKALGELEYYVMSQNQNLYPAVDQRGYHESAPFANWEHLRVEAMQLIAQAGGKIKYGHSEVGNFTDGGKYFEQHEIEFLPVEIEEAADQMVIAKWILRKLGAKYGVNISFAPKITVGKAGSGLHIHALLEKDGENVMVENDELSPIARRMIAGWLSLADALTAFGNTIPTSYLRLVPHQEAPTNICWGDRNRSVLVRVPLGWIAKTSMIKDANPQQKDDVMYVKGKQTVEFRAPDGSADIYGLLAGLTVAAQYGLENPNSLQIAKDLYVDVNIFDEKHKEKQAKLKQLPGSCWQSADCLNEKRMFFEKNNVFPTGSIDAIITKLKSYFDENLSQDLYGRNDEIRALVEKYLHTM